MASGLTAADIEGMRDTVECEVLPGTVVILERQRTSDGMGGNTNTYVATGTVSARLDYERSGHEEQADGGRVVSESPYILTLPHDAVIADTGRVTYDGVTYDVRSVLPRAPWDLCVRAEVVRFD